MAVMKAKLKKRRAFWVAELAKLSGSFGDDSTKVINGLRTEIKKDGIEALLEHLRFCGAMPERYRHDSSAEKLYSKYTDAVLSEAFTAIGLRSSVITARADAADVQARGRTFSLVADSKAFRLSRTAKNQKDFKIQAMDGWRNGLDYAVVVCPIYQLPRRTSQIYQQAISRNVCILSYTHFAAFVGIAARKNCKVAEVSFHRVLKSVTLLNPNKNASDYWVGINKSLTESLKGIDDLWTIEKTASLDALAIVKEEALQYLSLERDRILGLSHKAALNELFRLTGLDSRIEKVNSIEHGNLLEV